MTNEEADRIKEYAAQIVEFAPDMTKQDADQLSADLTALLSALGEAVSGWNEESEKLTDAQEALQVLQTRVGELEGALKPFATVARLIDRYPNLAGLADDTTFKSGAAWKTEAGETKTLTLGDFRRVASLTPPLEQE